MRSAKNSRLVIAFVSLLLALASAPGSAQISGYYLELSGGPSTTDVELIPPLFSAANDASNFDADSNMVSLVAGLRFNDAISVEVGYTDYGTFSNPASLSGILLYTNVDPVTEETTLLESNALLSTEAEYKATAVTASVIGSWPLSRRWSVFGKLGLAAWSAESEFVGSLGETGDIQRVRNVSADFSDNGSSLFVGAGVLYRFNLSYGVKLEYQKFRLESDIFSSDADIDSISVGLRLYL